MNDLSGPETPARSTKAPGLFYGYILVGAAFGLQVLIWGAYNSYGLFFNPLLDEFGWSRATVSGAASLSQIFVGVGAVSLGYLNDRFGPRALMTASILLAGLGYYLISFTQSVWQLYLFHGVIVGIGVSGTDVILLSTTARWFVRRRGMMSGVVKIGTGVGIMLAPFVVERLIGACGWRDTFVVLGAAIAVLGSAISQLLKRDPSKAGQYPDGGAAPLDTVFPVYQEGDSLGQAVRRRRFWMLGGGFFIMFYCTFSVIIHINTYVIKAGFSPTLGATVLSLIGGISIAGRLGMGMVGDRIGGRHGLLMCFLLMAASLAWLPMAPGAWGLVLFTLVYGLAHGGFYALESPTVAEFFGLRSHGAIFGILVLVGSLGGALGPLATGRIADASGVYQPAFLFIAGLAAVGFLLLLAAGAAPAKTSAR